MSYPKIVSGTYFLSPDQQVAWTRELEAAGFRVAIPTHNVFMPSAELSLSDAEKQRDVIDGDMCVRLWQHDYEPGGKCLRLVATEPERDFRLAQRIDAFLTSSGFQPATNEFEIWTAIIEGRDDPTPRRFRRHSES